MKKTLSIILASLFIPTSIFAISVGWERLVTGSIHPFYSDKVLIGATATTSSATLEVIGSNYFSGSTTYPGLLSCGKLYSDGVGIIKCGVDDTGGGGGGGLATSSPFTVGYIPYATSTNSLTNSDIFQLAGGFIGIGTTTPAYNLDIYGSFRTIYASTTDLTIVGLRNGHLKIDKNGNVSTSTISLTSDVSGILPYSNLPLNIASSTTLFTYSNLPISIASSSTAWGYSNLPLSIASSTTLFGYSNLPVSIASSTTQWGYSNLPISIASSTTLWGYSNLPLSIASSTTLWTYSNLPISVASSSTLFTYSNLPVSIASSTTATLSSLSSIGTITTGIWNATRITGAYGGLGGLATATGNLLIASSTGQVGWDVLTIGTDGYVLTASSTAINKLAWAPAPATSLTGGQTNYAPIWTSATALGTTTISHNPEFNFAFATTVAPFNKLNAKTPYSATITEVGCWSLTGSSTVGFYEATEASPNASSSTIFNSLIATTSVATSSTLADSSIASRGIITAQILNMTNASSTYCHAIYTTITP